MHVLWVRSTIVSGAIVLPFGSAIKEIDNVKRAQQLSITRSQIDDYSLLVLVFAVDLLSAAALGMVRTRELCSKSEEEHTWANRKQMILAN